MTPPPPTPAPHEPLPIQPDVESTISEIIATNRRSATAFTVSKHSREAAKNWDKFYKNHQDKFFKDRHWTNREFGSELGAAASSSSSGKAKAEDDREEETQLVSADIAGGESVLLEVGCGVGNMLYPLLAANAQLKVHCCDFSARAVDLVRAHPLYDPARVNAFVYDLTSPLSTLLPHLSHQPTWPAPTTISLIFVLSAIPPHLHAHVLASLASLASLLPQGGHILFRDYAYGDLSQVRYHTKKDAAWSEPSLLTDDPQHNWYKRGDNTFNYFFTQQQLQALAESVGLRGEVETLRRTAVNRKSEVNMERRFVQAKWYVAPSSGGGA
ncbi:related to ABP140-actin binding protein and AdoMet-dependent tRNA methyltransferase [Sporisorium reilianum f. sp. reilianum]|uniref:tRNA N(3)-methylcytidine methyltransferase n=1 Tax=Sporisorium reilianum f. sp. reilianum TaxID=72559 RepID=A0A2N8ULC5_9BASI|nr:related to ABP140-actin binding protein and AdoMet-dependent tRNA methyltransferase [Sporisorium reilianum f. sp. reilianum]